MTDNTLDNGLTFEESIYQYIWFLLVREKRFHKEHPNLSDKLSEEKTKAIAKVMSEEIDKRAKSLIADREKKMLEFVIGRGTHIEEKYLSKNQFIEQEAENKLRAKQRQRAKEWSKR